MSELIIRSAGAEDIDQVLAYWRQAAEGTGVSDDREGIARLIARAPAGLLLAERDGALVATVIAGCGGTSRPEAGEGWRCSLYRLAVHPSHRRQGVARSLLTAAEERFVALGGRRAGTRECWTGTSGRTRRVKPPVTHRNPGGAAG